MLVLTRKESESIVIHPEGDFKEPIRITFLWIGNGKVRVGIEAPQEIEICRSELSKNAKK